MGVGRFEYNSIKVDFERAWNSYQVVPNNFQNVQSSLSGITEVLELYNQHTIKVQRNYLSGSEVDQLMAWYEYVRDGSSFKFWRDKDLVLYLPFEKSITNRIDGTAGTFSRASTGRYLDRSTGEIENTVTQTPRYPEGLYGDGLLIERDVVNILDATEDFTDAGVWSTANASVTANQMIAPDGTVTADRLNATGAANITQSTATAVGSDSGTFSIWVRTASATQEFDLTIGQTGAVVLATATYTATTEWQRFTVTHESSGAVANNWYIRVHLDNAGETLYIWGCQLEVTKHETGYCPDTGSRAYELAYWSLPDFYDYRNWSLLFWVKFPWDEDAGIYRRFFNLTNDADSNCYLRLNTSDTFNFVYTHYAGSGSVDVSYPGTYGLTADTWTHIAFIFDSNQDDFAKLYIDGVEFGGGSNYQCVPKVTNRLYLGARNNGTEHVDGVFDDVLMTNGSLSATEIKAIVNSGRAIGAERSYYSAVRLIKPSFEPVKKTGLDRWDFEAEFEEVLT